MIYMLTLTLWNSLALEIFCSQVLNFSAEPNQKYEISLENPPNSIFWIIGRKSDFPSISITENGEWKSNSEIFSFSSFNSQSSSLLYHSEKPVNLFFSVCSFQSFESLPVLSYKENVELCNSLCLKNNGKCEDGKCLCKKRFAGDNCEIKNVRITEGYSKKFKISAFSFVFFECSNDLKPKFNKMSKNIHLFTDKKAFPSFFSFKNYGNEFKSFKNLDFCPFSTIFCADEECEFEVSENIDDSLIKEENIIIASTVIAVFLFSVTVYTIIKYLKKKERKIEFNETDIEHLAPTKRFEDLQDIGVCSICLSEFQSNDDIRIILKCSHCFHSDCISEWLQRKKVCPNCNSSILDER